MTPAFTITAGQRSPGWPMQLLASGDIAWGVPAQSNNKKQDGANSSMDLSDISPVLLHLCLYGARQTLLRDGRGQWSVVDGTAGVVLYSPAAEDVSIPGEYYFKVRIDHVGGSAPFYSKFVGFRIEG